MKENQEKWAREAKERQDKIDAERKAESDRKALDEAYEKQRQADIKAGLPTLEEINNEKARNAEMKKEWDAKNPPTFDSSKIVYGDSSPKATPTPKGGNDK
jgi:hypothetical protein